MANSMNKSEVMIQELEKATHEVGFKLKKSKTKVMTKNNDGRDIILNGKRIE